jgi:hypothetical protein
MSTLLWVLKLVLMVAANVAIVPLVLYNAYWTGEHLFGTGNGQAVAIILLLASAALSSILNKWLVTLPAVLCSLLALPFAPWGLLTGLCAFLCAAIAIWLNPQFLQKENFSAVSLPPSSR